MSEFLYDKAFMALKSQRYEEAQSSYEQVLQTGYTVEAWTGLGVCKLFQLSKGQKMQEVIYCFDKARNVEGANIEEINLKFISYVRLILEQYAAFAVAGIKNALKSEKEAATAALLSAGALLVGGMSNGITTKVLAGVAAGSAAGVAVGKFGEMKSSKEISKYAIALMSDVYSEFQTFIGSDSQIPEALELSSRVEELKIEIIKSHPDSAKSYENAQEGLISFGVDISALNSINNLVKDFVVEADEAFNRMYSGIMPNTWKSKLKKEDITGSIICGFSPNNQSKAIQAFITTEGIYTELLSIWGNTVNYIAFNSKPQFTFEKGSMLKFSKLKESSSKVSIDVGLMSEHDEDIAKIILDYINSQV